MVESEKHKTNTRTFIAQKIYYYKVINHHFLTRWYKVVNRIIYYCCIGIWKYKARTSILLSIWFDSNLIVQMSNKIRRIIFESVKDCGHGVPCEFENYTQFFFFFIIRNVRCISSTKLGFVWNRRHAIQASAFSTPRSATPAKCRYIIRSSKREHSRLGRDTVEV